MSSNYFTVMEFAKLLGVHRNTIYKGIKYGHIVALRLSQGKNSTYRIPKSETDRIAIANLRELFKTIDD